MAFYVYGAPNVCVCVLFFFCANPLLLMIFFIKQLIDKWDELLLGEFWRYKEVHFEQHRFQMSRPYNVFICLQLRFVEVISLEDLDSDWDSFFSNSWLFFYEFPTP